MLQIVSFYFPRLYNGIAIFVSRTFTELIERCSLVMKTLQEEHIILILEYHHF